MFKIFKLLKKIFYSNKLINKMGKEEKEKNVDVIKGVNPVMGEVLIKNDLKVTNEPQAIEDIKVIDTDIRLLEQTYPYQKIMKEGSKLRNKNKILFENLRHKYPNGLVILLINGHGGIVDGEYITAPNKMFRFEDGTVIYEGVQNRKIVRKVIEIFKKIDNKDYDGYPLEFINVVPGELDTSLSRRIKAVNRLFNGYKSQGKLSIVIEVHANAGGGTGHEVFTTVGQNFSDIMAETWSSVQESIFTSRKNRGTKEKNYSIIKNIKTFGILIESYFFDNREDVNIHTSEEGIVKDSLGILATAFILREALRHKN